MASTAIAQAREQIARKSAKIRELASPAAHLKDGVLVLGGAFGGGFMDAWAAEKMPDSPVEPSIGLGLIIATYGVAMRSPYAVTFASGLLAGGAAKLGELAYESTAGDGIPAPVK